MLDDVRSALLHSGSSLWRDLLGAAALGLGFYVLLHLPGLAAV